MGRHLAHMAMLKAILIRQMHGRSQSAFWNRVSQLSERLHLAVIGCISLRAVLPFLRLLIWVCTRLRLWGKGIRRELGRLFGGNGTLCSPSAVQMALVPKRDRERLFAAILWGLGVRPQGRLLLAPWMRCNVCGGMRSSRLIQKPLLVAVVYPERILINGPDINNRFGNFGPELKSGTPGDSVGSD
ncbi:MAG: hypothetical protein L6R36_001692 [Xanthoria steineri]|nr:MAG: hypothetical protein L6R36_001692 [Xanthoria steineri]